jgi:hypothetical protein
MDIDYWLLFLNFIESHPEKGKFWELHREVYQAHAEGTIELMSERKLKPQFPGYTYTHIYRYFCYILTILCHPA